MSWFRSKDDIDEIAYLKKNIYFLEQRIQAMELTVSRCQAQRQELRDKLNFIKNARGVGKVEAKLRALNLTNIEITMKEIFGERKKYTFTGEFYE